MVCTSTLTGRPRGQHLHQVGVLRRVVAVRRDADQVVGKAAPGRRRSARARRSARRTGRARPRRSGRRPRARRSAIALTSSASSGRRSRIGLRPPPRSCRTRTRSGRPASARSVGSAKKRCDCAARPAPARCAGGAPAGSSSRGAPCATSCDMASKSKASACGAADRLLQRLRLLAGLRVAERRAQDVRQLAHQAVDQVDAEARAPCRACARLPGVREEPRRHVARRSRAPRRRRASAPPAWREHLLERLVARARPAARPRASHSSASVPRCAARRRSARISRSSRSTWRRRRSPSMPRGATSASSRVRPAPTASARTRRRRAPRSTSGKS